MKYLIKAHDLAVMVLASYLFFRGEWEWGTGALMWWILIWFVRCGLLRAIDDHVIDPIFDFFDCWVPSWAMTSLYTVIIVLAVEGFLLFIFWKDAVNYIVSHY